MTAGQALHASGRGDSWSHNEKAGRDQDQLRGAFIHQTTPIEEASNDNGKFVAVLKPVAVALTKDTCCILLKH